MTEHGEAHYLLARTLGLLDSLSHGLKVRPRRQIVKQVQHAPAVLGYESLSHLGVHAQCPVSTRPAAPERPRNDKKRRPARGRLF